MSELDLTNSGAGFLPYLDELRCASLTSRQLEDLYAMTDWRVVLLDKRIERTYGNFFTVSLFKALALPYLIELPSERALDRVLQEKESLRVLEECSKLVRPAAAAALKKLRYEVYNLEKAFFSSRRQIDDGKL